MKQQKPFPAKQIGRLFLAVALAFYAGAAWILISPSMILTWPTANATVTAAAIDRFPAADGTLLFRVKLNVSFLVNGEEIAGEAISAKFTNSFAEAARQLRRFEPGGTVNIRYRKQNPKEAKFDTGLSWSYLGAAPLLIALGTVVAVVGRLIHRSYKPPLHCAHCYQRIQHHYKFCTACGAAVAAAPAGKQA